MQSRLSSEDNLWQITDYPCYYTVQISDHLALSSCKVFVVASQTAVGPQY